MRAKKIWCGNLQEKDRWKEPGVEGKITFKVHV